MSVPSIVTPLAPAAPTAPVAPTTPAPPAVPAARPPRRRSWPTLVLVALVVLVPLVAYAGPSISIATRLTTPVRRPITTDPAALGLAVEPVAFASREDGLALRGWLLLVPRDRDVGQTPLIIIVHGINGVRDDPSIGLLPIAAGLVGAGHDVLLFDLRGHGESADGHAGGGWFERRDLLGALDWAEARGYRRVGVHGFSMGAAAALLTAAEDPRVAAVAVDSAYADLGEFLAVDIPRRSGLPPLYTPGVLLAARLLHGADLAAVRPIEAMARLRDRPVLIVHGAADQGMPVSHAERLWAAHHGDAADRAWLLIVPGATHVQEYHSDPEAYMALVRRFWAGALAAPGAPIALTPAA